MLPRDKNIGSVHRHVYALRGDRVPHLRNMGLAPAPPAAFCDAEGCTAHLLAAVANRRVLSSFLVLLLILIQVGTNLYSVFLYQKRLLSLFDFDFDFCGNNYWFAIGKELQGEAVLLPHVPCSMPGRCSTLRVAGPVVQT